MDTSLSHLLHLSPQEKDIFRTRTPESWQTLASNMTPQEMDIIRKRIPVLEKELVELESAETPEDIDAEWRVREEITKMETLLLLANGFTLRT